MPTITELMSKEVVTIHLDDRLSLAHNLFCKYKFHHLLVVDSKGELTGILSDRDLFKAISPNIGLASETDKDKATLNKRVHQISSRNPISLVSTSSLAAAVKRFYQHNLSCLPIVNEANKPIGIMTTRDIIKYLYGKITVSSTTL